MGGLKRLGRRGGLLLMLAVLWVGMAAQVATTHAPYDVADAVPHERIPLAWRVGLWLASALIMAAAARSEPGCGHRHFPSGRAGARPAVTVV